MLYLCFYNFKIFFEQIMDLGRRRVDVSHQNVFILIVPIDAKRNKRVDTILQHFLNMRGWRNVAKVYQILCTQHAK